MFLFHENVFIIESTFQEKLALLTNTCQHTNTHTIREKDSPLVARLAIVDI